MQSSLSCFEHIYLSKKASVKYKSLLPYCNYIRYIYALISTEGKYNFHCKQTCNWDPNIQGIMEIGKENNQFYAAVDCDINENSQIPRIQVKGSDVIHIKMIIKSHTKNMRAIRLNHYRAAQDLLS